MILGILVLAQAGKESDCLVIHTGFYKRNRGVILLLAGSLFGGLSGLLQLVKPLVQIRKLFLRVLIIREGRKRFNGVLELPLRCVWIAQNRGCSPVPILFFGVVSFLLASLDLFLRIAIILQLRKNLQSLVIATRAKEINSNVILTLVLVLLAQGSGGNRNLSSAFAAKHISGNEPISTGNTEAGGLLRRYVGLCCASAKGILLRHGTRNRLRLLRIACVGSHGFLQCLLHVPHTTGSRTLTVFRPTILMMGRCTGVAHYNLIGFLKLSFAERAIFAIIRIHFCFPPLLSLFNDLRILLLCNRYFGGDVPKNTYFVLLIRFLFWETVCTVIPKQTLFLHQRNLSVYALFGLGTIG